MLHLHSISDEAHWMKNILIYRGKLELIKTQDS